ncbi:signal transducing adapter molecule 2-like isoform X1 [Hydractinia symbiolongicarpus]|uniref:signal transducing adapter molecule 2-like isoform X1 n=2 Tax=Hydractinia symbiolongicarpus TaxID=13093 RepID=UPI00254A786A|nr:signal transducing adapter molecule 2-like isoform X1 [Hydractinia symbiolongicarpus]
MPKSALESDIEKCTSEFNVTEDWQLIMDLCDRIKTASNGSKDGLKYITRRLQHQIPHISMQALSLLSACVENCGKPFRLEICSRDWTNEAKQVITRGHEKVSMRLRELIQKWAEDFKDDPQLNLMVQFYKKLKADGFAFQSSSSLSEGSSKSVVSNSKKQEDEINFKEDLDLAIAMSLQEAEANKKAPSSSGSLYPTFTSAPPAVYPEEREVCKVKALYDFEAAEDNEMTFKSGEIFTVLDNSDQNWWKGRNNRGVGLFPANFVTTDLSEPKTEKKKVRFADSKAPAAEKIVVKKTKTVINEEQLDLTLSMLKNASPNEIDDEEETICSMEDSAREMGTLLEKKILECDRQKDDLTDLNDKFLQALSMYQQYMKEPMSAPQPVYQPTTSPQTSLQYQQPHSYYQQHHQPQQYATASPYPIQPTSAMQHHQMDKSYYYQTASQQPASLPPQVSAPPPHQNYTSQPASLPPMSVAPAQMDSVPISYAQQPASLPPVAAPYPQQAMLPQQPASLPYDYTQSPYSQQYNSGQYYSNDNIQYTSPPEYSSYGYAVPQNTQSYQQVYQ